MRRWLHEAWQPAAPFVLHGQQVGNGGAVVGDGHSHIWTLPLGLLAQGHEPRAVKVAPLHEWRQLLGVFIDGNLHVGKVKEADGCYEFELGRFITKAL